MKGRATLKQLDSLFEQQNMGRQDRKRYLGEFQKAKKEADRASAKAQPVQGEKKSSGAVYLIIFLLLLAFVAYLFLR